MFARFSRILSPIRFAHRNILNSFAKPIDTHTVLRRASLLSIPSFMLFHQYLYCAPIQEEKQKEVRVSPPTPTLSYIECPITPWQKIKSFLTHALRFMQLLCIFMPPILLLPLKFFKMTEKIWLNMFVHSVEKAGVVWIKAFQYLSHRRDVIGPEMSQSFAHLRENAPQHSFQETKENFKLKYGKQIYEIFDEFDSTPIASGSVSQVYKAIYKGKKVAVKVRHPQVQKHIQRDVNILFGVSKSLALFSKSFEIPIGEQSLKKTLIDQIDFNVEKDNLNTFNIHFKKNEFVNFPEAFDQLTRDSILIESFVEGVQITHFQNNRHPLNAVIARLGASAFFQMLMKNNFIHADCHGGNILVQVTKQFPTFFGEIFNYMKEKACQVESKVVQFFMESESLRSLYKSSRDQQRRIRDLIRNCDQKVQLNLIDVGMVIQLNQTDKMNFVGFIKSVMEGNGEKCANMVYRLSNFDGKKIIQGKFTQYKKELSELFSILDRKSIFDIQGIELLIGMLNIIRENNMKLDGQFATLLTNMCILESIAKDIDPNIQILKCAVPFFQYVQQPVKEVNMQRYNSNLL